jgi:hypothetical protein
MWAALCWVGLALAAIALLAALWYVFLAGISPSQTKSDDFDQNPRR